MKSQEIRMSERLKTKIKREIETEEEFTGNSAETRIVDITSAKKPSNDKICLLSRCRLCAIPNNDMIDLFSCNSTKNSLVEKIEHCLCILVKESDALPKQICTSCLSKLELCYNFNETVAEAEKQLLALHEQASGRLEETEKNRQYLTLSSAQRDNAMDQHSIASTTVGNNPISANLKPCSVVLVPTQIHSGTQSRNNLNIANEYQIVRSESTKGKKKTEEHSNVDSSLNVGELSPSHIQSVCESGVPRMTRGRSQAEERKTLTSHCEKRVENVWIKQENLAVTQGTHTDNTCSSTSDLEIATAEYYRKILINRDERNEDHGIGSSGEPFKGSLFKKTYNSPCLSTQKQTNVPCDENNDQFSLCDKSLESLKGMNEQMSIDTNERQWQCDNCKINLQSKGQLQIHLKYCKKLSGTSERLNKCDVCAKTFAQKRSLVDHMKLHTGDELYSCKYCSRKFSRSSNRNRHQLSHTDNRPYKCSICEKTFNVPSKLRCHEVIHSDERNYPCSVCTKSFKLKSGLKVHMAVHTGEKPWQCDYCKRSFTRKTTIRTHVKICKQRY